MAYWHELSFIRGSYAKASQDRKTLQLVRRYEHDPELFEAYFLRQTNSGMYPRAEECIELWPHEPIIVSSQEEAKKRANALLELAADGEHDELFEKRLYLLPIHRRKVAVVHFPTHQIQAWICKHAETRYEVLYYGDTLSRDYEHEWRLPVPPVEGMPVPKFYEMMTLADSLESAEDIALIEMERIVSGGEIKPK